MFSLEGKTALVTGASGGIGSSIAYALAKQGARLALSGSNSDKLRAFREQLNSEFGHDHVEITCDLSNAKQVEELIPATVDTLGSMNFPQFSRILPYQDYDSETGLFINTKTIGFMLEARPLPGANKDIVATLEHLLRTKIPRGVPFTINLVSSKLVGDDIEYGLREFSWSGKQAEKFNAITRAYYLRAAETRFPLPESMDLPLTLRNYRVSADIGQYSRT
ncbi:SDR family NAD(P)-dependent oxidoreductase [Spongiibacter tropicus]|uniref:SDR family NAD(P)-dependent oxidoreductase n=1 Tax=Spongiibacter tropicus TaxID=454602 RepID=UPI0035BE8B8F